MDNWLQLPITYEGKELEFEVLIYQYGFIHRIAVVIDNIEVQFEIDYDENYRALISLEQMSKSKAISVGLLQAIAEQLKSLK